MPKKKPPAKRKQKRAAPQAGESHQRKQERLEARRRAKEQALLAQRKREQRARAARVVVFAAVITGLVWLVFLRETAPTEIDGNDILSFSTDNGGQQSHTAPYSYDPDSNGLNPPVSGRHNPSPAECGVHDDKIPDENFVHTLEHGAVAVLYDPKRVDLPEIRQIEEIVADYPDTVLSAPYPQLPDPIVLASWSRKMPLDSFEADVIREYIDTFRDTEPAPEFNGEDDCETSSDDAYEPPEPSPSPTPTGDAEDGGGAEDGGAKDGTADKGSDDSKMEKEEDTDKGDDDGTADKGSGDSKMEKEEEGN